MQQRVMISSLCSALVLSLSALPLWAAEKTSAPGLAAGDVLNLFLGLGLVVALILGCAWLIKRMGTLQGSRSGLIKVIAVLPLGTRERIALVEVGGQQLLLGITATQVTTLHRFDEPVAEPQSFENNSEFAQKLHQLMSRK